MCCSLVYSSLEPMGSGNNATQPLTLKLQLPNARSVHNKTNFIRDLIMDEHADPGRITETWLGEEGVLLLELCPLGFKLQQQPRLGGQGGGVAVVYRSNLLFTRRLVQQSSEFECLHLMLGA